MSSYYIMPKPGYTPEDLIREGVNSKNAVIVKIGPLGNVVEEHVYTPNNEARWNAKPHPSLYRASVLYELGGRTITLKGAMFEGYLADGVNPFMQLIWLTVTDRGKATPDDIVEYLIRDKKFLRDTEKNRKWLKGLIKYMRDQGYLDMEEGGLKKGDRELPIGHNRIPVKDGYNPILREMATLARRFGVLTKGNFADYMIKDLGWVGRDPVTGMRAEKVLEMYIRALIKMGVIREVGAEKYEFVRSLERYD